MQCQAEGTADGFAGWYCNRDGDTMVYLYQEENGSWSSLNCTVSEQRWNSHLMALAVEAWLAPCLGLKAKHWMARACSGSLTNVGVLVCGEAMASKGRYCIGACGNKSSLSVSQKMSGVGGDALR